MCCGRCVSGFGFLGWRFAGGDAGAHGRRVVGDSCWGYFLTNGLDLHKESEEKVTGVFGAGCAAYARWASSHLEADFLQQRVEVIEQPAAIKDERRLQHLLVNLFIIQLLLIELQGRDDVIKT